MRMISVDGIGFRTATSADVQAMAQCRLSDPAAGPADLRMAAYFDGQHHPQQARLPRVGYLALAADNGAVGYIAGHLTTRHACRRSAISIRGARAPAAGNRRGAA